MSPRSYETRKGLRDALDTHLRRQAKGGQSLQRMRQLVVFDRFLARVAVELGDAAVLKGGLALELRIATARTTIDVDLRMKGDASAVGEALGRVIAVDLASTDVASSNAVIEHARRDSNPRPAD